MLVFDYEEASVRPQERDATEHFLARCTSTVTYKETQQDELCDLSLWCGETHKQVKFVGLFDGVGLSAAKEQMMRAVLVKD